MTGFLWTFHISETTYILMFSCSKIRGKIPYHNLSSLNEHKLLIVEEIICIKKYELEDKDQLLYKKRLHQMITGSLHNNSSIRIKHIRSEYLLPMKKLQFQD